MARDPLYDTYAVTLYLDSQTNELILEAMRDIAVTTGNNYMLDNSVPPHLSLGLFHAEEKKASEMEKLFGQFAESLKSNSAGLSLNFNGPDNFADKVIFLSVARDKPLMKLNRDLHQLFLPHFEAGDNRNYLPENWVPHIALAVKLDAQQFAKGFSIAKRFPLPKSAKITSATLAKCNPYNEVLKYTI
ncbi:MAG: 2'-5' RNA ligase family protein [Treponema sp.]|nr:2'-5' RNA ligase family protein [Treponema sp.]